MDQLRQRIQDDLRGLVSGKVRCDDLFLQLYASDASIFQVRPLAVVRPRSTADVAACLRYCSENHLAVHPRGAGTSLSGQSLGPGVVLDFSHSMRRILAIDETTVRLQPGVVHALLNDQLRPLGRQFGPDPALSEVTTMGSVIAVDASGSRFLRYGSARQHIRQLQVVLADGTVLEVGRHGGMPAADEQDHPRRTALVAALADLIGGSAEQIKEGRPRCPAHRAGYTLDDVLSPDGALDLTRLLAGSEGTLAVVTEATLATCPLPASQGVALLLFSSLEKAARAVQEILPLAPSACELMDRRHLSLARERDVRYELLIPREVEAALLVEQDGDRSEEVRAKLADLVSRVQRRRRLAAAAHSALDPQEVGLYWQLARRFVPTLARMKGSTRAIPFVEDMAVPPESLPDFLTRLLNTLKRHHVTASLFGHAGHGQLHVRPFLDLTDPKDLQRLERLAADLYHEVIDVGGTISGEHGDGLSRTPFLAMQFGPLLEVFRAVKQIFDPEGILNPGKIVPQKSEGLGGPLRPEIGPSLPPPAERTPPPSEPPAAAPTAALQLAWRPEEMAAEACSCNGCGICRTQSSGMRMCPIFRPAPREEASPRAKANLVRAILSGQLDPSLLAQDELKSVADLCVHCHMCRLECPAEVDVPRLMADCKAAYVATNGLRPSDWFMTRIDRLSAVGSFFRPLCNWGIANRQARWLLEKTTGIAQGRKLPRFARRTFLQRAARRRLTRATRATGSKVVYFVDTYANYFDTQLAESLLAVMEHNGVSVYVDPQQKPSGMPMIAQGVLDKARQIARQNVERLADAVRQGYHIVATEPSAALCLTREYPALLDDEDARLVAAHTSESCQFLWQRHQQGKLQLDFKRQDLHLAYHAPCHLLALRVGTPGENLLRLVPGLSLDRIEKGCSGMAGTYGLKRENYRNSLRAGWGLISALRESPVHAGTTECSTCKMQMEQASSKPTIHPLKVLALAYGLMPQVASLVSTPGEDLVVT